MSAEWDGVTDGPSGTSRTGIRLSSRTIAWRSIIAAIAMFSAFGASVVVTGGIGSSRIRLPALAGPSYAHDISGFRPPSRSLIRDIANAATETAKRTPPLALVPVAGVRAKNPNPADDGRGSVDEPRPDPAPGPASAPPPALSLTMTSDTDDVHPNEIVTYSLAVTNSGDGTAENIVVASHIPDGTSLEGWMCDGSAHNAEGATSVTCGTDHERPDHDVVFGARRLAPAETITFLFWVRVNPGVRHNTAISTHAHCSASNADLIDSGEVSVFA